MATIRFNGQNASGYYRAWGITFPCGGTVETDNEEAIKAAKTHPEFEVSEKAAAKAENPPAEKEKATPAAQTAPKVRKPRKAKK